MRYVVALFAVAALATACSNNSSTPSSPSPVTGGMTSLAGTWTGTSADTTGQEAMTLALAQNGASVTGTMGFTNPGRGMMGTGSMQGTINGSTMTFHMGVPAGGFQGMMSACSMAMDGQATMSADGRTMTGTYSGSMSGMMSGMASCGGAMSNGQFTLTR